MSRPNPSKRKNRQYNRLPNEDTALLPGPQGGPMPGAGASSTGYAAHPGAAAAGAKLKPKQPNRTTKTAQKLTLFPEDGPTMQPLLSEDMLLPEAEDLFDQLTHIPPERIGKLDRTKLPRVTSYCVANAYQFDELIEFLKSRPHVTAPRKFDECVYVALNSSVGQVVPQPANTSAAALDAMTHHHHPNMHLGAGMPGMNPGLPPTGPSLDLMEAYRAHSEAMAMGAGVGAAQEKKGELFLFEYGVVVFWGFSATEERTLLRQFAPFESEPLDAADVEGTREEFSFHYNSSYQPRIYNDIISLKSDNYMAKLTISHAIAQSTKLTLFEGLMDETISATKHIPQTMAETGKVPMSRTAITKKIGQLFIMRINVNLVSNVLDVPEVFWGEPALEPLYQAIRGYLEINQRVELLNQRLAVISDLLDMLKEHLTSTHGEALEWIVIILIGFEIVIGIVTILFDYFSYIKGNHE
ncbi:sporulation protein rmd1 [Blastocladiella emersonii ATCC 22665]|nr:sporulation protein rmd1 [Blastocladiella emersonii ATCC 22665]